MRWKLTNNYHLLIRQADILIVSPARPSPYLNGTTIFGVQDFRAGRTRPTNDQTIRPGALVKVHGANNYQKKTTRFQDSFVDIELHLAGIDSPWLPKIINRFIFPSL
jgi:hypothetical protein